MWQRKSGNAQIGPPVIKHCDIYNQIRLAVRNIELPTQLRPRPAIQVQWNRRWECWIRSGGWWDFVQWSGACLSNPPRTCNEDGWMKSIFAGQAFGTFDDSLYFLHASSMLVCKSHSVFFPLDGFNAPELATFFIDWTFLGLRHLWW